MSAEIIKGLNPYNEPEFYRLAGIRREFSGTTPIPNGSSLESTLVQVEGYPYFVSEIVADQPCTLTFRWYSDKEGLNLLDTVAYNYTTSQGLRLISGSVASDFLKVTISNSSGLDMTSFSHRLKLSASPNVNLSGVETSLADINTALNTTAPSATVTTVALNATTSTVVLASSITRIHTGIYNSGPTAAWIKFQTAVTDNDKKGIYLSQYAYYEMPEKIRYTGEISAIADSGTPTLHVTAY